MNADTAWQEWKANHRETWHPRDKQIAEHFYRRALQDAADDLATGIRLLDLNQVKTWLRDRAVGVTGDTGGNDE